MNAGSATTLREINAKIANAYDTVPFDSQVSPGLDPELILKIAARAGKVPDHTTASILDLGCGTGSHLERIAGLTSARVVGTDLSRTSCDKAAARAAPFGERCKIVCADFLDLDPFALGTFDLIYLVGVLYITPVEVQRHILDLIAGCLKPRGVVLISYYSGAVPLLMAGLHDMLHGAVDPSLPPLIQIEAARAQLRIMGDTMGRQPGDHRLMNAILHQVYKTPDHIFFHEMLNQNFCALSTAAIEAALAPHDVHFINWTPPAPFADTMSSRQRAAAADALVFGSGGYFYGVFQKN